MATQAVTNSSMPKPAARAANSVTAGGIAIKIITYIVLGIWTLIVMYPMLWSVMSSFKTDSEIFDNPWALPVQWVYENFVRAWTKAQIGAYVGNTFIVIIPAIIFTLLLSSMAAYVFARYDFRFKNMLFYTFLAGTIFPIFLALVPLFLVMKYLGQFIGIPLLNTFHGLIIVYVAFSLPWTIFFMTGFFKTLPKEIAEAATIDGATHAQIFFQVMLPLAKPGLVSAGIFNFLGQWNQFILPTVLMSNANLAEGQTRYVVSQGMYYLQNQQRYQSDWSGLFAAVAIITIPTFLVFIIFNNRIEKGLTVGAVKG